MYKCVRIYIYMQARPILMQGDAESYRELIDPRLENNYNRDEMFLLIISADASIRHSSRRRPKMSQVFIYYFFLFLILDKSFIFLRKIIMFLLCKCNKINRLYEDWKVICQSKITENT